MVRMRMPKFLSELTPSDWFKIVGIVVMGTLMYADVHSKLGEQIRHNQAQDTKIAKLEQTIADAIVRQGETNEKIADTLGRIDRTLSAIEANSGQIDKRVERIERRL